MSQMNPLCSIEGKRTARMETRELHHDTDHSKLMGKRELYRRRNETYVKAMYGNTDEKEIVRRNNRISLQQQMQEQDSNHQRFMTERFRESQFAIHYDKACLHQDAEDKIKRVNYLKAFRDENKKLMEMRAEQLKKERQSTHTQERKLLHLNPINWTKTLH